MEKNEIKKALYKQDPMAYLVVIKKGNLNYATKLEDNTTVLFEVPVSDIGDAGFFSEMSAKLLIRWIV